jgi:hypothetical protein
MGWTEVGWRDEMEMGRDGWMGWRWELKRY